MSQPSLIDLINVVRENSYLKPVDFISPEQDLRADLGFDSLALAELTVRIEDSFGVDVFSDGVVYTVGQIQDQLPA